MDYLKALTDLGDPTKAEEMARYHKVDRTYLGVPNPVLNDLARAWRADLDLDARLELARSLWDSDTHEGRILAAKLLTQARIRPDTAVWRQICDWVPEFDGWAVADHACMAGHRRVMADPARLDEVETWTRSDHMWTRRAALVITLPFAKLSNPKPDQIIARDRILTWAASYVPDHAWFIQKSIAWWVRDLSKHDPDRSRAFLNEHGDDLKAFARKEAGKYLVNSAG